MARERWLTVSKAAKDICDAVPGISKSQLAERIAEDFHLSKARSVYFGDDFAIRFCHASGASFSNCVVSLAVIKSFDHLPILVCILRSTGVETVLANSTFINKVSHSSHKLTVTNIRGTILGHDILKEYDRMRNAPENFEALFARHNELAWDDNLERIVENTHAIIATGERFQPTDAERSLILASVNVADETSRNRLTDCIEEELTVLVQARKMLLMQAAKIDNGNLRGNTIESILTEESSIHSLEDQEFKLKNGVRLLVDIKSKLLDRKSSSPKLYNVDKFLKELADGNTLLSLFCIGIDVDHNATTCRLVNVFDSTILNATRVQFHWAGRNSRGVTQLAGDVSEIFESDFSPKIDVKVATAFVTDLLAL